MKPAPSRIRKTRWLWFCLLAGLVFVVGFLRARSHPAKGTVERGLKVGSLERSYLLHVPAGLRKDQAAALVLMFHGGGGTAVFAERESKFSELAEREGFIVAYPQGVGRSWNDGRGSQTIPALREHVDDLGYVSALIDAVAKEHVIERKRVFATGISNGAIFSHYLAGSKASSIAAIAPVAGGMAEPFSHEFHPDAPVSVLILQGTDDPLVPYHGGEINPGGAKGRGRIISTEAVMKLWSEHDGCQPEMVEEDLPDRDPKDGCRVRKIAYGRGTKGTEVVLLRVTGGGHTWPNGMQYLPASIIGRLCRDFDATETIWEFFKNHPKP